MISVERDELGLADERQRHSPPVADRPEPRECLGALPGRIGHPAQCHREERVHEPGTRPGPWIGRLEMPGQQPERPIWIALLVEREHRAPDNDKWVRRAVTAPSASGKSSGSASSSGCLTWAKSQLAFIAVRAQTARACTTSRLA